MIQRSTSSNTLLLASIRMVGEPVAEAILDIVQHRDHQMPPWRLVEALGAAHHSLAPELLQRRLIPLLEDDSTAFARRHHRPALDAILDSTQPRLVTQMRVGLIDLLGRGHTYPEVQMLASVALAADSDQGAIQRLANKLDSTVVAPTLRQVAQNGAAAGRADTD